MLKKLRYLFADDNNLQQLPDEICYCNNLTVLSVSRNRINELPSNIGQLSELKVLNIVRNCISTLPVSLLQLRQLTSLWISDNQSQPLVPLQYIHIDNKSKLTCFMLPQNNEGLPSEQFTSNTNENPDCKQTKNMIDNYRRQQKSTSYQLSLRLHPEENNAYKSRTITSFSLGINKSSTNTLASSKRSHIIRVG